MKIILRNGLSLLSLILVACVAQPALYQAAIDGDINKVKNLLDSGVNVNQKGGGGLLNDSNPLNAASSMGHANIVKLLISRGANVNAASGSMGWTPLSSAAWRGYTEIVNILVDNGADIDKAIVALNEGVGTNNAIELLRETRRQKMQNENIYKNDNNGASVIVSSIKSDIDIPPVTDLASNSGSYAVVIGIENYRQKLQKADFAVQDAKLVAEYLIKTMGYPEENVITLTNEHANKSDLEKYLGTWLKNNVEKGGTVFVYYSGHGAPNPNTGDAYLVPYDGDPSFISDTGYPLNRLYESLGSLPAKKIIVALDSCFSGAGDRSVLPEGARPLVIQTRNPWSVPTNMIVLSASSSEQISSTYKEKGHGLFTYFLLKGIKSEDVIGPDGSLRIDDLYAYLKPQVERVARKQYNTEQTPQMFVSDK